MIKQHAVDELIESIEALGEYRVTFGSSNPSKPSQQLIVWKKDHQKPVARMSLMLACRINTMQNGVGRSEKELLKLLVDFSMRL